MPVRLERVTWIEDEVAASEQWEVNAATAHDAVKKVTTHIRFSPHHVDAKLSLPEDNGASSDGAGSSVSRLLSGDDPRKAVSNRG